MARRTSLNRRLEGLVVAVILGSLVWVLLSGPLFRYLNAQDRIVSAQARLLTHETNLSAPKPASDSLKYRSFVNSDEANGILESGAIQSRLISIAQDNRARLVDLRVLETDTSIETLSAERFRLDVEGDLIAVLGIINGLAAMDQPVLIDGLNLAPVGNQDRPDRRLRADFELSFWTEGGET